MGWRAPSSESRPPAATSWSESTRDLQSMRRLTRPEFVITSISPVHIHSHVAILEKLSKISTTRVKMAHMLGTIHRNSRSQLEIISPVIGTPLYAELENKSLIPHYSIEHWSRFSDWKCAEGKDWIASARLYESFPRLLPGFIRQGVNWTAAFDD